MLLGYATEHAVHELGRVGTAVDLGHLDSFVDRHRVRNVVLELDLVDCETQDVPIDDWHSRNRPMLGSRLDLLIDSDKLVFGAKREDATVLRWLPVLVTVRLGSENRGDRIAGELALIQHLQRLSARSCTFEHQDFPCGTGTVTAPGRRSSR